MLQREAPGRSTEALGRSVSPGLWGFFHESILCLHLRDASSTADASAHSLCCSLRGKRNYRGDTQQEEQQYYHISEVLLSHPLALDTDLSEIQSPNWWFCTKLPFFFLKNKVIFCKLLVIGDFCDHFISTCHSYLDTFLVTWCQDKLKDLPNAIKAQTLQW